MANTIEIWRARLIAHGIIAAGTFTPWRHAYVLRGALEAAQGGNCGICGDPLGQHPAIAWKRDKPVPINLDHVVPKGTAGGFDGVGNLLATHSLCNTFKGGRLPTPCEIITLIAACDVLRVPVRLKPGLTWIPPPLRGSGV